MKKTIALATALCMLLSSCYFNSAGHLFVKGGYKASADSSDAQVQPYTGPKPEEKPPAAAADALAVQWCSLPWDKRHAAATAASVGDLPLSPGDAEVVLRGLRLREGLWKCCAADSRPIVPLGSPLLRVSAACSFPVDRYAIVRGLGLVWGHGDNIWLLPEDDSSPGGEFWKTIWKYVEMQPGGSLYSPWPSAAEGA